MFLFQHLQNPKVSRSSKRLRSKVDKAVPLWLRCWSPERKQRPLKQNGAEEAFPQCPGTKEDTNIPSHRTSVEPMSSFLARVGRQSARLHELSYMNWLCKAARRFAVCSDGCNASVKTKSKKFDSATPLALALRFGVRRALFFVVHTISHTSLLRAFCVERVFWVIIFQLAESC